MSEDPERAPRTRLADKALTLATGAGIQNAGQVAVNLFLVRLLDSQELFGTYRQVWLVIYTLSPFVLMGLGHGLYFFLPGLTPGRHRAFACKAVAVVSGAGLVASIAVFLTASWIAGLFNNQGLVAPLRAASFYPLFALPSMLLLHFLIAKERHGRAAMVNLVFFFLQSIVIIALALTGASLSVIFSALVALAVGRFGHMVYEILRHTEGRVLGPSVGLGETLGYSVPVGLSDVLTSLGQKLDKLVVASFLNPATYAVYALGAMEFPGIILVSTASNTVMRPHITGLHHKADKAGIHRFWRESFRKQALVIVPMAALLAVFARELMILLYTEGYADAAVIFQIYLAVSLFRIAPPLVILTSVGLSRAVLYGTLVYVAVNLGLSVALIGVVGRMGPPVATFVATAGLMGYYARRAAGYLGVSLRGMIPAGVLLRLFLVAGVAALSSATVKLLGWHPLGSMACGAVVFALVYAVMGRLTRVLQDKDLDVLRRWLRFRWIRGE